MQADINGIAMRGIIVKRDQLESDLKNLARLMGEERFADRTLLFAMSRRMGLASSELSGTEKDLAAARLKAIKLDHTKEMLKQRIRKHEIERDEQSMMDFTEARVALELVGQCAARKRL